MDKSRRTITPSHPTQSNRAHGPYRWLPPKRGPTAHFDPKGKPPSVHTVRIIEELRLSLCHLVSLPLGSRLLSVLPSKDDLFCVRTVRTVLTGLLSAPLADGRRLACC